MGTVYKAHDSLIERTVAIKTVNFSGLSHEEAEAFEERFYREAKSAGRLNHPNIVTIHDVGRSDDLAYIAMEYLPGQSLRDLLDSGVVLPLERIAEIAAQIAEGLAFAHANDVVHRDIKPANIMVLDNDIVKIADFGVALLPSGSHTVAGTAFGSPKYMSPEQVTGLKADGRSDIFSLGAVLYEMLAGRPPFTGDDLNAILYQVLNSAPPLPSSINPGLPHGFDRIVARALAKNPDKRYQYAAEMAADLRKYRRFAKQAQKKQNTASPPSAASPPSGVEGEATVTLKVLAASTTSAPGRYARALRYGISVLVLTVLAAWLLRPVNPQLLAATPTPNLAGAVAPRLLAETASAKPHNTDSAERTSAPRLVADGRIRLAIAPWGEVYVDGKIMGVTPPLAEVRLPAGKHRIEVRNGAFAPHRQSIDLAPNASVRIKHKFE